MKEFSFKERRLMISYSSKKDNVIIPKKIFLHRVNLIKTIKTYIIKYYNYAANKRKSVQHLPLYLVYPHVYSVGQRLLVPLQVVLQMCSIILQKSSSNIEMHCKNPQVKRGEVYLLVKNVFLMNCKMQDFTGIQPQYCRARLMTIPKEQRNRLSICSVNAWKDNSSTNQKKITY